MIPVPRLRIASSGPHLVTGVALNKIMMALRARTQMDPREVSEDGMAGQTTRGGGPRIPPFRRRFDERSTYVLSPGFLAELTAAIRMRSPREAAIKDANGWNVGGLGVQPPALVASSGGDALKAMLEAMQSMTPRNAVETNPNGYRMSSSSRRGGHAARLAEISLTHEDRWAEAFYCTGIFHDGVLYTTSTTTTVFQHGTVVYTTTQPDMGPHIWNPSHPTRFSCNSTVTTDDHIPGKDYGFVLSNDTTYSGAVDAEGSYALAAAAVEESGSIVNDATWSWHEFEAPASAAGFSQTLAAYMKPTAGDYVVHQPRYRWANTGRLHVGVRWKESGEAYDIVVAPGENSDWYLSTLPGTPSPPGTLTDVVFYKP